LVRRTFRTLAQAIVHEFADAHARVVEAGGRSVWTPRATPEPG
jgi:hypothetical protein